MLVVGQWGQTALDVRAGWALPAECIVRQTGHGEAPTRPGSSVTAPPRSPHSAKVRPLFVHPAPQWQSSQSRRREAGSFRAGTRAPSWSFTSTDTGRGRHSVELPWGRGGQRVHAGYWDYGAICKASDGGPGPGHYCDKICFGRPYGNAELPLEADLPPVRASSRGPLPAERPSWLRGCKESPRSPHRASTAPDLAALENTEVQPRATSPHWRSSDSLSCSAGGHRAATRAPSWSFPATDTGRGSQSVQLPWGRGGQRIHATFADYGFICKASDGGPGPGYYSPNAGGSAEHSRLADVTPQRVKRPHSARR